MIRKFVLALATVLLALVSLPALADSDEAFACTLGLCLSNPGGADSQECQNAIGRMCRLLRDGKPIPHCSKMPAAQQQTLMTKDNLASACVSGLFGAQKDPHKIYVELVAQAR